MNTAILEPLFNSLLGIAITVILGLATAAVNKYVTDKNAREAIAGALSNAAGVALAYGQSRGDEFLQQGHIRNQAMAAAAAYVADQAPKALAHFGQSDADIATKVEAKVATALSLATPIPATTVDPLPIIVAGEQSGSQNVPTPTAKLAATAAPALAGVPAGVAA